MCGIAGLITTSSRVEPQTIRTMCDAIIHRGPDEDGLFVKDGVGLGMRRLSIIDLAGGHQPVFNEDRTCCIVFNGEIYNFPELRKELEARGHRFSTHTDTEVIIHLYEDFGENCVQKLRGMFAFAIYDDKNQQLLLARDRLGKKPLHYAFRNGQLFFASEIKSILAVSPDLAEENPEAILQYLHFGYIPDPLTAFRHIKKLAPGHLLTYRDNLVTTRKYWELPAYGTRAATTEQECLEEIEHKLAEAVRIRLVADVPLGGLLSGGTDSSTVVALMARASSRPVKTFSIGFQHDDFSETKYARIVAEKFGTDHHELVLDPDIVQTVETLSRSMEEPFGDSSMLPTYYVSCLARKYVTVALSGDGGDEVFAGYGRYGIHARRRVFERIPRQVWEWYRRHLYPKLPKSMHGRKFAYNISLPWVERYVDGISFLPAFEREVPLLSDDFREQVSGYDDPRDLMFRYFKEAPAQDAVSKTLYVDTKTYLTADILTKVDRMSMAASLELRAPILDHIFVEWATALPVEWKLRGNFQKFILVKLAEKLGVPREVLYRRKQGFSLPLVHWMRHELKEMIQATLLGDRALQRAYFRPEGVRQLVEEHFTGRRDQSARIWRLMMLELWHRNFLERVSAPDFAHSLSYSTPVLKATG